MVKKIILVIIAAALVICLAACGSTDPAGVSDTEQAVSAETETNVPSEETQEEAPAEASGYQPERCETDNLTWDFDAETGTLSIHGSGPMRGYAENAPEWDQYRDETVRVVLDDGITSVGAYAFFNSGIKEAVLPDSIEVIDDSAFDFSTELETINIPASLRYVGMRAFYNTLIWNPADLVFPEGCEYIGDYAFHSALKSGGIVSLPSTLAYLGKQSFTNAYLSDFVISEDNPNYCTDNHAVYTKDMKEICMLAPVSGDMTEFRIPDGVERIPAECFNVIQGIKTVYIPASVTDIEEGAFFSTFDLTEIAVDSGNKNYRSENGILMSIDGKLLLAWPDGIEGSDIVIPDGTERIGAYVFYGRGDEGCNVVIPEGVKEIGSMSLPYNMGSLSLPASLEKIDDDVFYEGLAVGNIYYNGTEADFAKVSVGEGNETLGSVPVQYAG